MSLTKINQIHKKYKELHQKHKDSWEDAQKRIRAVSPLYGVNEAVAQQESLRWALNGNKIFDAFIKELEGHELFPKKDKTKK